MARVQFTPQLERFLSVPAREAEGDTVRAVLTRVFEENPRLRGYVFDDQGHLRQHVAVFVDGELVKDRVELATQVGPDSEIFVMQALSGG
jgi:molybdopterin synthase sulfur carrier subunit